jgi:hypothetical protein
MFPYPPDPDSRVQYALDRANTDCLPTPVEPPRRERLRARLLRSVR